jgi:hypothetical protein
MNPGFVDTDPYATNVNDVSQLRLAEQYGLRAQMVISGHQTGSPARRNGDPGATGSADVLAPGCPYPASEPR